MPHRLLMFGLGLMLASCTAPAPQAVRVVLIPADGGTASGTIADYQPLFAAIGRTSGLTFDLKVAQSYSAVVEALCHDAADVAFVGAVTYLQARERGCARLLAVAVRRGQSSYHAVFFARSDSGITAVRDLRGKRVALGDVNSTASFVYPVAMLVDAGLDPARDLAQVRMLGSHAGSLAALIAGHVDAAALSLESFEKASRENVPGVSGLRAVARSEPIPYPPLVVRTGLPATVEARLRKGFEDLGHTAGVSREVIRGYGGGVVDGYDTKVSDTDFAGARARIATVDDRLKGRLLQRAAER